MNKIKNVVVWVGALLATVFVITLLMPSERLKQISEVYGRMVGSPGVICLDYHRKKFKDPDSAELIDSTTVGDNSSVLITTIVYKAKNSYGAFVTSSTKCRLFDGKIHEKLTEGANEIEDTLSRVEESNRNYAIQSKCREQLAKDMPRGMTVSPAVIAACVAELKR